MFLLIRKLITENSGLFDPETRRKYGSISGIVGICLNILLFAGKLSAAIVTGSVAIIADAFNNLSDAGSSVVTMVGFRLSGKKPDPQHPFGHGRLEYITGFIVSIFIILMGFELALNSIRGIRTPKEIEFSFLSVGILSASIAVKLYMALYNKKLARIFDSAALNATATDSLSDVVATSAVLLSIIVSHLYSIQLDSYAGLLVSLFVLYSGINSARDTIAPLLGSPPSTDLVLDIEKIVMSDSVISGMHDLVIHDYGPGRLMISLHAEVPSSIGVFEAHEVIDNLENELGQKLNCEAVIHFDPVDIDDEELSYLKSIVNDIIKKIDERISIHDFRYVPGESHTNLIFDIVVPYGSKCCDDDLKNEISNEVQKVLPNHFCVIKCDNSYV